MCLEIQVSEPAKAGLPNPVPGELLSCRFSLHPNKAHLIQPQGQGCLILFLILIFRCAPAVALDQSTGLRTGVDPRVLHCDCLSNYDGSNDPLGFNKVYLSIYLSELIRLKISRSRVVLV